MKSRFVKIFFLESYTSIPEWAISTVGVKPHRLYRCKGLYTGHDASAYDTEVDSGTSGDLELDTGRPPVWNASSCFYKYGTFAFTWRLRILVCGSLNARNVGRMTGERTGSPP